MSGKRLKGRDADEKARKRSCWKFPDFCMGRPNPFFSPHNPFSLQKSLPQHNKINTLIQLKSPHITQNKTNNNSNSHDLLTLY